jgi:hypothetical protein
LQLTTDGTSAAKAQYLHAANTALADVTDLAYLTKHIAASSPTGAPSYQLVMNLLGTSGYTTLVYGPHWNGTVTPGVWQDWDADAGQFWSSNAITCPNDSICAGSGGAPFYTLEQIQAMCPDAVVIGFGVNVGSYNPSYDVLTDGVVFNDTTYNFELAPVVTPTPTLTPTPEVTPTPTPTPSVMPSPTPVPSTTPTSKDACKDGGWESFNNPAFKNQGDCVSFVASEGKAGGKKNNNPVQAVISFFSSLVC